MFSEWDIKSYPEARIIRERRVKDIEKSIEATRLYKKSLYIIKALNQRLESKYEKVDSSEIPIDELIELSASRDLIKQSNPTL